MPQNSLYQNIEEHETYEKPLKQKAKKIGVFVVIFIVFGAMLGWGLSGFMNDGKEGYVAEVGYEVITEMHVETEIIKLQKKFPDPSFRPYIKGVVVQDLILSKILKQEAKSLNLDLNDKVIAEYIAKNKEFQEGNKFDKVKFANFLSNSGLTENEYIDRTKQKIITDVIVGIIGLPKIDLSNLAEYKLRSQNQKRNVDLFILPKQNNDIIEVSEQELSDFYLSNKNLFTQKANAKIEYISSNAIIKKNPAIVTTKEVEAEFNKVYGGKYAEHRSLYMLTLSSQEDVDKAIFLLKNRKKTFIEVASMFDKKEKDILVENISYFDLQSHVRDVVFDLPVNKISKPIQISADRLAIVQVNKISSTKQDIVEKNKIIHNMYSTLLQQKNCEKVMAMRDEVRDMIASGKKLEDVGMIFGLATMTKNIVQNSEGNKFDKLLDKEDISEGYIDIIESGECEFDLIAIEKLEKFRNKEFNEAYSDVTKALKQSKAQELSLNMANDIKNQLEHLDNKNVILMNNFIKGRNMQINRNLKILNNNKEINQDLHNKIFNSRVNDVVGPILFKDGSYVIAILRGIENNSDYKKTDIEKIASEIWQNKQNDMQELYKNYLYKKYNVKIYK